MLRKILSFYCVLFNSFSFSFAFSSSSFLGSELAANIMSQVGSLLTPLAAGNITYGPEDGADTDNGFLFDAGVPVGVLLSAG